MTARPNWRKVADTLARQMAIHAFCDSHSLRNAQLDCPFCQDRAAYRVYLAAGGQDFTPGDPPGTRSVPLAELRKSDHFKRPGQQATPDRNIT